MYFTELKNVLEQISPLAYQRVVLKCIDYFKQYGFSFGELVNPQENMQIPKELINILNEKVLELYDVEIFV